MKDFLKNAFSILGVVLLLALVCILVIPGVYKLGKTTFDWAWGQPVVQVQQPDVACPSCPVCPSSTDTEEKFDTMACMDKVIKRIKVRRENIRQEELQTLIPQATAMCQQENNGQPGISNFIPGTIIPYGTITFDLEDRVWILENFRVPSVANYNTAYIISGEHTVYDPVTKERYNIQTDISNPANIFLSPFWMQTELGWLKDYSRVDFKVCYNFKGDCALPQSLIDEMTP
ncbi:MAG: hypothetical protein ACOX0R_02850 [Candidatus Dojkabacteria bacterium]|jgi:hypothetical protein